MDELELFVKTMMLEAGFKPEQLFDEEIENATAILIDRLNEEIMEKLNEDDRDIFVELVHNNESLDQSRGFAEMKIENFDYFIKEKSAEFRLEYLEGMSQKQ
jgi:mRNA-degrading endonuclease RelE of RelBE toxin-antitoxin system